MKCEKCGKNHDGSYGSGKFCSSFCAHQRDWTEEKRKRHSKKMSTSKKVIGIIKKRSAKNRIAKKCMVCGNKMSLPPCESHFKFCSKKCQYEGLKLKIYKSGSGGYRKGSGHGKSGWYKGIQCDSSYELAWIIYNLEHGIKFVKNQEGFEYKYEGKKHKYYPDFYLKDEKRYVEIKGFRTKQHDAKVEAFKEDLVVLYKNDLKEILKYVIDKYGKNFIELYEGNPHKQKKNKCLICGEPCKKMYCSQKCAGKSLHK